MNVVNIGATRDDEIGEVARGEVVVVVRRRRKRAR
jgi:hypothetical protein